ncbi:MAG TPA: hypothetical protein VFL75_07575 [Candidatus Limnocylindria bacterium]|nr:hypothetical protein [Candidatus Limnocylindria bacterium]
MAPRGIALGVYPAGFPVDRDAVARYAERAGRAPAIVHYFRRWTGEPVFDPEAARFVHDLGAVPMVSWEPWQGLQPIIDGAWDAQLTAYARAVADYGQPLFVRFAHEMNLPQIPWFGSPATFRSAWEHVRSAFDGAGATNVRWVWSPYVNGRGVADLRAYFPGPHLVDWPALDGYNWGRRRPWQRWPSFDHVFGASLAAISELMPAAPVMLAEVGCAERGGDKAAWMREALLHAIPGRHPEIRAVVWFDHHRPEHADWRIDSSPSSLTAWREAAADPRYQLSGPALADLAAP